MNDYNPPYLASINSNPVNIARFITRQADIETFLDKKATVDALTPRHMEIIEESALSYKLLRTAEQVHGDRVAMVGDIGCPFPVEGVDSLICSHRADCCLGIYVADCAAVWIYDARTGARGLLHSGKVGTELNIVGKTLQAMYKLEGTNPEDCVAVISPCIRPPHFEVDIAAMIKEQLLEAGVLAENITDSGLDTATDLDSYYSYRMEKGKTGRMLALFGRTPH